MQPSAAPIVVHGNAESPFSFAVRLLACEAGEAIEHRELDLAAGATRTPEYLALNPLGSVPFLEDGLLRLGESGAILRYLAKAWGLDRWYPHEDYHASALVDQWLDYNQAQYWRGLWFLFMNEGAAPGAEPFDDGVCGGARRSVRRQLDTLAWALDMHPYVTGDEPTIADLSIGAVLHFGMPVSPEIADSSAARAYLARLSTRPAWAAALKIGR